MLLMLDMRYSISILMFNHYNNIHAYSVAIVMADMIESKFETMDRQYE